jgi:hypothetical protein
MNVRYDDKRGRASIRPDFKGSNRTFGICATSLIGTTKCSCLPGSTDELNAQWSTTCEYGKPESSGEVDGFVFCDDVVRSELGLGISGVRNPPRKCWQRLPSGPDRLSPKVPLSSCAS